MDAFVLLKSSQYAEPKFSVRSSEQIKMIDITRQKSPHTSHCMKISQYLSVIIVGSAIWSCLSVKSSAQSFNLKLPGMSPSPVTLAQQSGTIAQTDRDGTGNSNANKDLRLREIGITRDSSDKSLLVVKGSIDNRSDRPHYVYYIVAKFISKDSSIKQAIIPVNSQIEPGESAQFNHEISTESINSLAPETVKPVVVKYEYR
jgi:hypothetical protein